MTDRVNMQLMLEAKFFKGLADKSRLTILEVLMDGEKVVGEIVKTTGLSQSNASMHLACLLDCGLVLKTRQGQHMQYRLANEEIFDCMHDYDHHQTSKIEVAA